jgi:hypothetical protein
MKCEFETSDDPEIHICTICGEPMRSKSEPARTHRRCKGHRPAPPPRAQESPRVIAARAARPGQINSDPLACSHRGVRVGKTDCKKPGCNAKVIVYSCEIFGECVLSRYETDKASCHSCEKRSPLIEETEPQTPTTKG